MKTVKGNIAQKGDLMLPSTYKVFVVLKESKRETTYLLVYFQFRHWKIIACIIKFIVLKNVPVYHGDFKSPLGNTIKVCMYVLMS